MKKLITILSVSSCSLMFSQEEPSPINSRNEIKLNLLSSIIGAPEITYERLLKNNQSIGLSAAISLDSKENLSFNYGLAPYYRIYFGKKENAGFFVEANTSLTNYHYENFDNQTYQSLGWKNESNFGFGAAIGFKLLTKNNLTGEVFGGLGRRFGTKQTEEAFPRIGISIGKRF